jgi:hypothetical protein
LLAALAALFLLVSAPAEPQSLTGIMGDYALTGYVGPGDLTLSATAWYSCTRAYSHAVAAAHAAACVIRRPADSATCTASVVTAGNVDYTIGTPCNGSAQTISDWLGGTASVTACAGATSGCTSNGTNLYVSAVLSGTLKVGSKITCTGCSANTYITAVVTPNSQYTIGVSQHFASQTVTWAQSVGLVTTMYDQTGGNKCASAACDLLQATAGNQPSLIMNCIDGMPCVQFTASTISLASANNFTPTSVESFSAVGEEVSGTANPIFIRSGASGQNQLAHVNGTANQWALVIGGSNLAATATDAAWHAANAVSQSGTNNTILNIDGTETTGTKTLSTSAGPPAMLGAASTTDDLAEAGFWDGRAFNLGQRNSICLNQSAEYALSLLC